MPSEMHHAGSQVMETQVSRGGLAGMTVLTFAVLAVGLAIAGVSGNLAMS